MSPSWRVSKQCDTTPEAVRLESIARSGWSSLWWAINTCTQPIFRIHCYMNMAFQGANTNTKIKLHPIIIHLTSMPPCYSRPWLQVLWPCAEKEAMTGHLLESSQPIFWLQHLRRSRRWFHWLFAAMELESVSPENGPLRVDNLCNKECAKIPAFGMAARYIVK